VIRLAPVAVAGFVLAASAVPVSAADEVISTYAYRCDADKTIDATYYADKVDLALSDGRKVTLPQVISGSGTRYANADESLVFWSKGDDAFLTEGDAEKPTYANCFGEPKKN